MADLTSDTRIDSQSPSSRSTSGNELKDGIKYENRAFQCTVPFYDTDVLDVDTEEMDNPNYVEKMRTRLADECEEEVVLDSDDEGKIHRPEVVGAVKGLSFDANGKRVQGDALDSMKRHHLSPPCEQDKEGASAGKRCIVGYSRRVRRVSSSVHARMSSKGNDDGSNFIQTDTQSQKHLVLKDDGILRVEDQYLVDKNLKEVFQDHGNWKFSNRMTDTLGGNKGSSSRIERTDGKNDLSESLACDHGLARLNHNGSPGTGESSQANALDFVDRFLSCNNVDLSQGVDARKTVKEKSPPVSSAKGLQSLAKRIGLRTSTIKMGTFEWADSQQDEEGKFFSKRTETFFNSRGHGQRSATRPQNARHLVNKGGGSSGNECEEKEGASMVRNSKEIGTMVQVSEMNIERNYVKELDERLDSESLVQQLEVNGIERETQFMSDVFNTQMAAEVMETLLYAPPADCSTDDAYRGQQNTLEDSLRGVTKDEGFSEHPSFQKRASSGSGGNDRKLKQIKRCADKLSEETTSSAWKHSKRQKRLDCVLKVRSKEKRAKPMAEGNLNCRNLPNVSESSCRRSSKPFEQRKAEGAVDRESIKEVDKHLSSSIIVEHTPLGEGQLQGECRSFSPIDCQTRQSMSVSTLNQNRGPNNSGEGISDVMEIGFPKYRKKGSGLGANTFDMYKGKRAKFRSNMSEEARNSKLSQQEQRGEREAASTSCLKLDIWSYPRRKRTHRNMTGHSNVARNLYAAFTVVDGPECKEHSIRCKKRSKRNAKTTCVNLDMRRKTRSSVYTCPSQDSSEKNSKGSFLRNNFDNPGTADKSNCETAVMTKRTFLLDTVSPKASLQSGKLDDIDSTLSADGGKKNLKLAVLSKESGSECNTSVNCTNGSNVASRSYVVYGYHKQPCNKNLPKSSLIKELIQLGVPELTPNFSSKDLRKRRDMANIRVLFSQHLGDNIITQQKKILARLGISIALCSSDATHFITDKFVRTMNMLEAIALGKPVVTHLWLESCGQASCFIDEKSYILRDAKKEKEIGFSMPVSLARASRHPLLKGQRVFITPNIKPGKELIASLIKAVHGQAVEEIQKSAMKDERILDDLLIISCEEDYAICVPFLDKGAAVYSSELLLNGIVIQKLEYESRHQLFRNHVKRNYCSISSRKDSNLTHPVAKCK